MCRSTRRLLVILISLVALLYSSCATIYRPHGFSGGYASSTRSVTGAYEGLYFNVSFSANGFTPADVAHAYFLARAGELALDYGYRYFVVVDSQDVSTFHQHITGTSSAAGSRINTTATVRNIRKPAFTGVVYVCNDLSALPVRTTYYIAKEQFDLAIQLRRRELIRKALLAPFVFGANLLTLL